LEVYRTVRATSTHDDLTKQKVQYRGRKQFVLDCVSAKPDISQPRELLSERTRRVNP